MSVAIMRDALKRAPKYNHTTQASMTWSAKVDRMRDNQIIAVYYRMLRGGELT